MKITIQILLFLFSNFSCYGQYGVDRYEVDMLQLFSLDKSTYKFNLDGPNQGLFFDSVIYDNLPTIKLEIYNHTSDTIIWKYREHDDHLMWLRTGSWRDSTLLPNEKFELKSAWPSYIHGGPVNSAIDIQYKIKGNWKNCRIRTWGILFPEGYPIEKVVVKVDTNKPKNPDITNNTRIDSLSISIYNLDSLKGQLYNNEVSVKFRSLNSSDSSFVLLDFEDEKTLFINRNSSGWVELQITERNGVSYMRTLYLPLYRNTENKPIFYIFKSDYVDYFQGTERPFEPDMDLVYIWSYKEKTRNDYKSKLDIIGINSISERFPAIHKYSQEISRSNQIEQLLKFDSIFITPVYKFEEDHCRYWSNQVEILTNPNMNVKELNELLNSIGIPNAFAINKYSRLKDYSNCSAFRIEFDTHDMLSYEFLTKLEILYNLKPIYKIFTHGIQGVYSDRYGIH